MKFCSTCGSPRIELRVPDGDTHARHVCAECGHVHYLNPKVVVGCLPAWEHRILLCRRAIEPRYGLWTLPAGFLELGETTAQGALRETDEEAGARVELGALFTLLNVVLSCISTGVLFIGRSLLTSLRGRDFTMITEPVSLLELKVSKGVK